MRELPQQVADFLRQKVIAVAGVSRTAGQPANAIYRRLKESGHTVYAVNPHAAQVEGDTCYPDVRSIPDAVGAVMVVTPPDAAVQIVRECAALGIRHVWFHRSFGQGSVSDAAVQECRTHDINCIAGGCPMMYCEPVDVAHRCMRWLLALQHKVPT